MFHFKSFHRLYSQYVAKKDIANKRSQEHFHMMAKRAIEDIEDCFKRHALRACLYGERFYSMVSYIDATIRACLYGLRFYSMVSYIDAAEDKQSEHDCLRRDRFYSTLSYIDAIKDIQSEYVCMEKVSIEW